MMKPFMVDLLKEVESYSNQLLHLADRYENECFDDSCLVLIGIIRDSAYKLKNGACIHNQIQTEATPPSRIVLK